MMPKIFSYQWEWHLQSAPEKIWPLISDTNRFNFDTSVPAISRVNDTGKTKRLTTLLQLRRFGVPVTWYEEPFEWIYPERFGVLRKYIAGPVKEMKVEVTLTPEANGTKMLYKVTAIPQNLLGLAAIPIQIGIISARAFAKVVQRYDRFAAMNGSKLNTEFSSIKTPIKDEQRFNTLFTSLQKESPAAACIAALKKHIINADDFALNKLRPYALASDWELPKKEVLSVFLHATRLGILELHWDILCPLCRGVQNSPQTIKEVTTPVHCDSCNINFDVNFDRLVEISFKIHPSIKEINIETYCIGGPQVTPHIIAQQILAPLTAKKITLALQEGAYRIRSSSHKNGVLIRVDDKAVREHTVLITKKEIVAGNSIHPSVTLEVINETDEDELCILERMAFADDAITAAELTAMQIFRDLFAAEALRPGEHISVGKAALLFTDLRNSTRMYRHIGDAKAFGYVMDHFAILKDAISRNDGAIVKTIGDAVMAVFINPAHALSAIIDAKSALQELLPPYEEVTLKAGIHFGPCIAVNLNNNFDYFGSTVNIAARLEGLSDGSDIIISGDVFNDHSVQNFLSDGEEKIKVASFESNLKGFENEPFSLFRIRT